MQAARKATGAVSGSKATLTPEERENLSAAILQRSRRGFSADRSDERPESPLGRLCAIRIPDRRKDWVFDAGVGYRNLVFQHRRLCDWPTPGYGELPADPMSEKERANLRRELQMKLLDVHAIARAFDPMMPTRLSDLCCYELEPKPDHVEKLYACLESLGTIYFKTKA